MTTKTNKKTQQKHLVHNWSHSKIAFKEEIKRLVKALPACIHFCITSPAGRKGTRGYGPVCQIRRAVSLRRIRHRERWVQDPGPTEALCHKHSVSTEITTLTWPRLFCTHAGWCCGSASCTLQRFLQLNFNFHKYSQNASEFWVRPIPRIKITYNLKFLHFDSEKVTRVRKMHSCVWRIFNSRVKSGRYLPLCFEFFPEFYALKLLVFSSSLTKWPEMTARFLHSLKVIKFFLLFPLSYFLGRALVTSRAAYLTCQVVVIVSLKAPDAKTLQKLQIIPCPPTSLML